MRDNCHFCVSVVGSAVRIHYSIYSVYNNRELRMRSDSYFFGDNSMELRYGSLEKVLVLMNALDILATVFFPEISDGWLSSAFEDL